MSRLFRYSATLLGFALVAACDASHLGPDGVVGTDRVRAVFPRVLGSWDGTAAAHVKTNKSLSYDVACPLNVVVSTQTDNTFSGTVAVQPSDPCKAESGTIEGTVEADGTVTVTAYASDGKNVFESAAARTGCTLVRTSGTFAGTLVGNVLNVEGTGVYDCPFFGGFRAFVDVNVSATKA